MRGPSIDECEPFSSRSLLPHGCSGADVRSNALMRGACRNCSSTHAPLTTSRSRGIVQEATERRCEQVFGYQAYLDILNEGADPLLGAA